MLIISVIFEGEDSLGALDKPLHCNRKTKMYYILYSKKSRFKLFVRRNVIMLKRERAKKKSLS